MRRFVTFSEACSRAIGIEPQHHQLLLAIRGLPPNVSPAVGRIAERLQIPHENAVDVVSRCADKGLVTKRASENEKNEMVVEITPRGQRLLEQLTLAHRGELG